MTVEELSEFVTKEIFLTKSRARKISHVTSAYENLQLALTEVILKCKAFTMLIFKAIGLGHLSEEFVIQIVKVMAITPWIVLIIALALERR